MFLQTEPSAASARALEYHAPTALHRLQRHRGPRPFVVGQLGQSLDGRIATPTGASKYINGHDALCHLHRLRAAVDAVVVGVGHGERQVFFNTQLSARADERRLVCRLFRLVEINNASAGHVVQVLKAVEED